MISARALRKLCSVSRTPDEPSFGSHNSTPAPKISANLLNRRSFKWLACRKTAKFSQETTLQVKTGLALCIIYIRAMTWSVVVMPRWLNVDVASNAATYVDWACGQWSLLLLAGLAQSSCRDLATGEAHETCQYNTCTVCTYPRDVKPITYEIGYFKVKKFAYVVIWGKFLPVGFLRINIFNFEISCEKIREL